MKRCPTCSRVYDDVSLRFCLDDGTELANKVADNGPPVTAVLPVAPSVAPTMEVVPQLVAASESSVPRTVASARKKRKTWPWALAAGGLAAILMAGVIVGALLWAWRTPLPWHLVLEVQVPPGANESDLVNHTAIVIRNRLSRAGVSREVRSEGRQIFLDLPKTDDPERIKRLISTSGKLELAHVISTPHPALMVTYDTREEASASLGNDGNMSSNRRVLLYSDPRATSKAWVVVEIPPIVDGTNVRNAYAQNRSDGTGYDVMFSLNKAGADKFAAWTGANIGQYVAVILNDEIKSIAHIRSQIADQVQITSFSQQEAEDLALILEAGALSAPIKFVEERVDK